MPERSTSYLVTNLPAPGCERAQKSQHSVADVAEVARLYALRSWIEQSYKQVKNSLGWAHYQVRKDLSIRRHWQLVCCAFSFCWWACAECEDIGSPPVVVLKDARYSSMAATEPDGGEKVMLLRYWRAYTELPPPKEIQALLGRLFSGEGLYLYVH